MKKIANVIVFLISIIFINTSVFCQTDDGTSMSPIINQSLSVIEMIESNGFEIVRIEYDILKDEKESFRTLQSGWTYNILAFGDNRVQDIDLEVYKFNGNDWDLIQKDTDESSIALVTIKPVVDGLYRVVVKGHNFLKGSNGCHYALIYYHE